MGGAVSCPNETGHPSFVTDEHWYDTDLKSVLFETLTESLDK